MACRAMWTGAACSCTPRKPSSKVSRTPPVPGTTDQVDVNFTVKERPTGNLMLGAGFSSAENIVLSASIAQQNLFGSGNNTWSFVPQIRWPIFDGGSARAAVKVAQANRDIAVTQYEKSIQTAFREVSDALADRAQWQERLSAQQAVVDANARAFELSEARFTSGVDNYLTVLDSQRSLYAAQQTLIGLRQSEQANRVALWKVLGGEQVQAPSASEPANS
mgnify:CR=1 FL=1